MEEKAIYHISVLTKELLEHLDPQPDELYVDATLGGGGHSRAILEQEPTCRVIGMDWDLHAIEQNGAALQEQYPDRFSWIWSNFAHIEQKLKKEGITHVNGIIADFGTSQFQIFERPGFSFSHDTPLDMRMSTAHQKVTAAQVIAKGTERELMTIFKEYGDEIHARPIARAIIEGRVKKPIKTTGQLSDLIERTVKGRRGGIHPATKVFQALRIYVNRELENIHAFLPAAVRLLAPGGRLVCISFHSLEDRIVKQFFRDQVRQNLDNFTLLTPKAIEASKEEQAQNRSSRSAKLRALKKR